MILSSTFCAELRVTALPQAFKGNAPHFATREIPRTPDSVVYMPSTTCELDQPELAINRLANNVGIVNEILSVLIPCTPKSAPFRSRCRVADPQLEVQLRQQLFKPACMSTGFHPNPHLCPWTTDSGCSWSRRARSRISSSESWMAGMERRRSSAASLEFSAASRADWFMAGKSAALIADRASSENLIKDPSINSK